MGFEMVLKIQDSCFGLEIIKFNLENLCEIIRIIIQAIYGFGLLEVGLEKLICDRY